MVNLDTSRDYYADLELSPDASSDDIRRQYRKLALKYHPDRNPGRENECSPRFQAIQAANEILGDSTQRAKYDNSRKKGNVNSGSFARPTPPRRRPDPFPSTTNYPPPPRRSQPRPTSNVPPPTANGGAQRYTRFAQPPPPPQPTSAKQDAKDRANMFNAWQSMHNAQKSQQPRKQGHAVPPPYTGPRFAEDQDGSRVRPGGPSRSSSTRVPPRPAFESTSPPYESGPSGPSASYNANRPHDRINPPRPNGPAPQPPYRGQAPTAKKAEFSDQFKGPSGDVPYAEGSRERTPYVTHIGEKTYFNPDPLRRSESVRDTTKIPNEDERWSRRKSFQDMAHQTSASPPSNIAASSNLSTSPAQSNSQGSPNAAKAKATETGREKPTPFIMHSDDEEISSSDPSSMDTEDSPGPSRRTPNQNGQGGSSNDANASDRPKAQPSKSWSSRRNDLSPLGKSKSLEEKAAWRQRAYASGTTVDPQSSVFTFPINHDTFTRTSHPDMKSPKVDGLQTPPRRFSHTGANPSATSHQGASGYFDTSADQQSQHTQDDTSISQGPPTSSNDGTFQAERWSNNLREDNWASRWAHVPAPGTSPPRQNSSNMRRQRVPKSGNRPASASVTAVEEQEAGMARSNFDGNESLNSRTSRDSNAMDIDSEPPATSESRKPSITVENTSASPPRARPVVVETARPEWRDDSHTNYSSRTEAILPAPKQHQQPSLSMTDFRHVPPLSTSNSNGLKDLSDLSTTLPFESQSSSVHPARLTRATTNSVEPAPFRANLPKPPRPPQPPSKYTNTDWKTYVDNMAAYMSAFHTFNSAVVNYFQNRAVQQSELERGPDGGVLAKWLGGKDDSLGIEAEDDGGVLGGWEKYMEGLRDDERVRSYWGVACERHSEAIERFVRHMEAVKQQKAGSRA